MRLEWFEVSGFKNLRDRVELQDIGPLAILHGENGIGKSNLLEAIAAFFEALAGNQGDLRGSLLSTQLLQSVTKDSLPGGLPDALGGGGAVFTRLIGQPVRELFNLTDRSPIRFAARFEITEADLLRWGYRALEQAAGRPLIASRVGTHKVRLELRELDSKSAALSLVDNSWQMEQAGQPFTVTLRDIPDLFFVLAQFRPVALIPTNRQPVPAMGRDGTEVDRYSHRDLIPPELCLALHDSASADEPAQREAWGRFLEAMKPFADLVGGTIEAEFDRKKRRARLSVRREDRKLGSHLLGAGIQQLISLIGLLVIHPAPILLLEEPELNLRHPLQQKLSEVIKAMTQGEAKKQIILSTHSSAFEDHRLADHAFFYGMERVGGSVTVTQRPLRQVAQFTFDQPYLLPNTSTHTKQPPCWVNADGLVEVPKEIRDELGLRGGGGVFFVKRKDTGHIELLTDQQLFEMLELRGPDDDEASDGRA